MTDPKWWEEVVVNEEDAEDIEARQGLQFLIDRLGSQSKAAQFLGVDQRLVNRNIHRMGEGKGLTNKLKDAIQRRLQVIPRRRSDNPIEKMAWRVEHLDQQAKTQKRATIEVSDRLAELERERQGPPTTWYAEMDTVKQYSERISREMAEEVRKSREEREQYRADMELVLTRVLQVSDMISEALRPQEGQEQGTRAVPPLEKEEMAARFQALSQTPEFQRNRRKLQEMIAEQAKSRTEKRASEKGDPS